ncbi:hypothetical protein [Saccharopolyspora pogona]|nr:hypothetical protein [Saccharopolyspora pogona]
MSVHSRESACRGAFGTAASRTGGILLIRWSGFLDLLAALR